MANLKVSKEEMADFMNPEKATTSTIKIKLKLMNEDYAKKSERVNQLEDEVAKLSEDAGAFREMKRTLRWPDPPTNS